MVRQVLQAARLVAVAVVVPTLLTVTAELALEVKCASGPGRKTQSRQNVGIGAASEAI